jgi:hypothetical protein
MAERKAAGFNIPLNFYDGPEVSSIPKRIRAAAVGVWALAGDYSATKLTDGYVPADVLENLGCTDKIRAALKVTINVKGELSPLWVDGPSGGIQLTNWPKHQRTNAEVTAYLHADAERKRLARETKRNRLNSQNTETSEECPTGHPPDVRADSALLETETETKKELFTYVDDEHSRNVGGDERGLSAPIDVSASRLVATLIPDTFPAAVRTALRLKVSELINRDHINADDIADALRKWLTKPDAGPGLLPNFVADIQRARAAPAANGRRPTTNDRVARVLAMKTPTDTKELEP